tara:strand:- start:3363 stop:3857 length:495 start_codon:yes stop_codon:yes gene_type:complete
MSAMTTPSVGSLAASRSTSRQALKTSTTGRVAPAARVAIRARLNTGATTHKPAVSTGALHAAALACGSVGSVKTNGRGRSVIAKASGETSKIADSVFNVSTEKLPGGDKLTNEGILGFFIAGFFAVWLGGTAVKTFAVMIGFFFTAAKYFAMGIALVLIGIAAS